MNQKYYLLSALLMGNLANAQPFLVSLNADTETLTRVQDVRIQFVFQNSQAATISFSSDEVAEGKFNKTVEIVPEAIVSCYFDWRHESLNEDIAPSGPATQFDDIKLPCQWNETGVTVSPSATLRKVTLDGSSLAFENRQARLVLFSILPISKNASVIFNKKNGVIKASQAPVKLSFSLFSRDPLSFVLGSTWIKENGTKQKDPDTIFESPELHLN